MSILDVVMIVFSVLLVYLIMNWDIKTDYVKWKKDLGINHENEAWIRGGLLSPSCIMLTIVQHPNNVWSIVLLLILSCFLVAWFYWTIFDGRFNNKRRLNWWFPGSKELDDSWTESLLHQLTKWQAIIIKIGGCLILLTTYILCLIRKNS